MAQQFVVVARDAEGNDMGQLGQWQQVSPLYTTEEQAWARVDEINSDGMEVSVKTLAECQAQGIE